MRGAQNRSPAPNRTPGRYPAPAVPKIALRVLAVHYPERLPAHPPWIQGEAGCWLMVRSGTDVRPLPGSGGDKTRVRIYLLDDSVIGFLELASNK